MSSAPHLLGPRAGDPVATVDGDDVARLLRQLRRGGAIAIAVWFAVMLVWSVAAPISGAVVANGLVKVEANRLSITHRDGGIVAQVLVHEGEVVRKGQPLIVLEDVRVDSSVDLLKAQLAAERLRRDRLSAEMETRADWAPSADDTALAASNARLREALAREKASFEARRRTLTGQTESLRAQRRDTELEIAARIRDGQASNESLKILKEELASNESLLAQGFIDHSRVRTIRRGVADYQSRIESNEAELAKARQRVSEIDGRMQSLQDAYRQQAAEDLRDSNARVVDYEEKLRAVEDTAGRQQIVAPADGRLIDLKVNTVGSAIGPREPVVDLVPANAPLVVEVKVTSDAVGEVRPGQAAEVRLLSYKQRSTHMLDGKVLRISADALTEQRSGTPYFAVVVEMDPASLAAYPEIKAAPGLAAEVYIRTSERTPLDFLIEPLVSGMRRGFREH